MSANTDRDLTSLRELITPNVDDIIYTVDDPEGFRSPRKLRLANLITLMQSQTSSTTLTDTSDIAYKDQSNQFIQDQVIRKTELPSAFILDTSNDPPRLATIGRYIFSGNNANLNQIVYGEIECGIQNLTADSEHGTLSLKTITNGNLDDYIILNNTGNAQIDILKDIDMNNNTMNNSGTIHISSPTNDLLTMQRSAPVAPDNVQFQFEQSNGRDLRLLGYDGTRLSVFLDFDFLNSRLFLHDTLVLNGNQIWFNNNNNERIVAGNNLIRLGVDDSYNLSLSDTSTTFHKHIILDNSADLQFGSGIRIESTGSSIRFRNGTNAFLSIDNVRTTLRRETVMANNHYFIIGNDSLRNFSTRWNTTEDKLQMFSGDGVNLNSRTMIAEASSSGFEFTENVQLRNNAQLLLSSNGNARIFGISSDVHIYGGNSQNMAMTPTLTIVNKDLHILDGIDIMMGHNQTGDFRMGWNSIEHELEIFAGNGSSGTQEIVAEIRRSGFIFRKDINLDGNDIVTTTVGSANLGHANTPFGTIFTDNIHSGTNRQIRMRLRSNSTNHTIGFLTTNASGIDTNRIQIHNANNIADIDINNSRFNIMDTSSIFSEGDIQLTDNNKILLGSLGSGDCEIYHDTNNTLINNMTGNLNINSANGSGINLQINRLNILRLFSSKIDVTRTLDMNLNNMEAVGTINQISNLYGIIQSAGLSGQNTVMLSCKKNFSEGSDSNIIFNLTHRQDNTTLRLVGHNNSGTFRTFVDFEFATNRVSFLSDVNMSNNNMRGVGYVDFVTSSAPAIPADLTTGRLYVRQISPTTHGLFIRLRKNGAYQEVAIA